MICRILLLITLTSCVCGTFVVNVTQSSYQAEENQNITLEWTFTIKKERPLTSLSIYCETYVDRKALFHLHEGVEVPESQDEQFAGRVQFDKDVLREGQIRLHVSRLRTDDSGLYLCEVSTNYGVSYGECWLIITAAAYEQKTPRPTESPQPESPQPESPQRQSPGKTGLYIGLTAALLALCAFSLCFKKCIDKRDNVPAAVQMLSLSEKNQNESSECWMKTSDIKPRDRLLDSLPPTSVLRATNLSVM